MDGHKLTRVYLKAVWFLIPGQGGLNLTSYSHRKICATTLKSDNKNGKKSDQSNCGNIC
jgi:hypothetical protein